MGRSIRTRCARGHRKTDVKFDRLAVARCRHMICRMSSKPFNRRFADPPSIVFVRLEMIQGARVETLGVRRVVELLPQPES